VVFSGGGDGSFIHLLNLARDYVRERNVEVQKQVRVICMSCPNLAS
jgi:hypothetical protein